LDTQLLTWQKKKGGLWTCTGEVLIEEMIMLEKKNRKNVSNE